MGIFTRKRKSGVVYGIAFQHDGAQQQELVGPNKAEARQLLVQRKREVAEGTYSREHKTGRVSLEAFAETWSGGRTIKTAKDERRRMRRHLLPHLGKMPIGEIRPKHIIGWIKTLRREAKIGPQTIRHAYNIARLIFRDALIEELVQSNPCVVPDNVLPPLPAKEPGIYEKPDVIALLTDERIPEYRRVFYAMAFFTGMRHGEIAGRRWRDWDPKPEPLGALHVRTQYRDEPLKAPDGQPRPRVAPVHPELARMLAAWKLSGFAKQFGRLPRPDDFIVPSTRGGGPRTARSTYGVFTGTDCPEVGVQPLTFHRTRDTFASLCRRGGARKDVVEKITHNATGDTLDTYTHFDWAPLCEAVLCLGLTLKPATVIQLPRAVGMSDSMSREPDDHADGRKKASGEAHPGPRYYATSGEPSGKVGERGARGRASGAPKTPSVSGGDEKYVAGHRSEADAFDEALADGAPGAFPPERGDG
jgi:integrase